MKRSIIVIIAVFVIMGLVACGNKRTINPIPEISNDENDVDIFENKLTDEEMYGNVINDYRNAKKEFDDVNIEEAIEDKYGMVNATLIQHVARYEGDGVKLTYGFYDIDKNGVNELLVGASGSIGAVYSYDSSANKPVKVFFQSTMERGNLDIYDNGIIFSNGSGGAALHYYEFGKIAKDEISYELLEEIEEEYIGESVTPVYRNNITKETLEYKNLDEILNKYISNSSVVGNIIQSEI